jgi:hypothetical protein
VLAGEGPSGDPRLRELTERLAQFAHGREGRRRYADVLARPAIQASAASCWAAVVPRPASDGAPVDAVAPAVGMRAHVPERRALLRPGARRGARPARRREPAREIAEQLVAHMHREVPHTPEPGV